ncbi:MAG: peptide deformylase [Tepidisphaeraceae bacterium]
MSEENSNSLEILCYPDPRLRQVAKPVDRFDDDLAALAARMIELMHRYRGVGLAAPQVGVGKRIFVMNPTGQPGDDRIYVNPQLVDLSGEQEAEEGCLSLPDIHVMIVRSRSARMVASNLTGEPFDQAETEYVARVWQHEFDHLNGILLTDRMGDVARMTHRRALRELEEKFAASQPSGRRSKPARPGART